MRRAHAVKVAAVTTAAIAVVYVACATVVNLTVSAHLTAQTDGRLADRLGDLRRSTARLSPPVPSAKIITDGDVGSADDDAAPVLAWVLDNHHQVTAHTPGAPPLPARVTAGAVNGRTVTASFGTAGTYRLKMAQDDSGVIVVGLSLAGQHRIQQWSLIGEVTAGPVLLLAMFLGALLIGLRAQAPIEQSRRRQVEFTADASHELRTPLSVIRAETDLALATPRKAADYRDTLVRIRGESERLRRLVEDMLWLARFDSQPAPVEEGPADVVTVARGCADRFRSVGPAITAVVTGEPALINAPPEWIDRLAGVLLDNACRYAGPDGQVVVGVTVNGNRVTLTVEDSGPGIPADLRPRLFDRFSRATEKGSGTGLGLAIGDSVVRSSGGRWEVGESPLGGARLGVTWRLAQPHRGDPHSLTEARGGRPRETRTGDVTLPSPSPHNLTCHDEQEQLKPGYCAPGGQRPGAGTGQGPFDHRRHLGRQRRRRWLPGRQHVRPGARGQQFRQAGHGQSDHVADCHEIKAGSPQTPHAHVIRLPAHPLPHHPCLPERGFRKLKQFRRRRRAEPGHRPRQRAGKRAGHVGRIVT